MQFEYHFSLGGSKWTQTGVKAYPSTAVFQENVNVFFVLKVVVKLHYMLMMKDSVKLYFFVNLFPLMRFSYSAVRNNFCSIDFVVCQICHLVTFGKATLKQSRDSIERGRKMDADIYKNIFKIRKRSKITGK